MANITAALVKELRERTGAGMMDCKKALVECDGDMDRPSTSCVRRVWLLLRRRPAVLPLRAWLTPSWMRTAWA